MDQCKRICFLYCLQKGEITETEDTLLWCNHEKADTKKLFHVGHLVAQNNVVGRTTDTYALILAVANIGKHAVAINVWFEIVLHTSNTLRYVIVTKLHQALGNGLCVALPRFHALTGSDYLALFNSKGNI